MSIRSFALLALRRRRTEPPHIRFPRNKLERHFRLRKAIRTFRLYRERRAA